MMCLLFSASVGGQNMLVQGVAVLAPGALSDALLVPLVHCFLAWNCA